MAGEHLIEYQGERMSISELARKIGMNVNTLSGRLHNQRMTVEEAINTPVAGRRREVCRAVSFYDCFNCEYSDCIRDGWVTFKDAPLSVWKEYPMEGIKG